MDPLRWEIRTNLWRQEKGVSSPLPAISFIGTRVPAQLGEGLGHFFDTHGNAHLFVGAARGGDARESGAVIAFSSDTEAQGFFKETFRWQGPPGLPGWGRMISVSSFVSRERTVLLGVWSTTSQKGSIQLWREAGPSNGWVQLKEPVWPASLRLLSAAVLPGDMDGDGFEDLVLGFASSSVEINSSIELHFFRGTPEGFQTASSSKLRVGECKRFDDVILQSSGDIDSDGGNDIVLGLPKEINPDGSTGRVAVVGFSQQLRFKNFEILNAGFGEFGRSISASFDVDEDGLNDLVVGAPGNHKTVGAVIIYKGTVAGWNTNASYILRGSREGDLLGTSTAFVDNGKWQALAIGAPSFFQSESNLEEGAVFVLPVPLQGSGIVSNQSAITLRGGRGRAPLGQSMVAVGDLNKDGLSELAISLAGVGFHVNKAGRIEIVSLPRELPASPRQYFLTFNEDPVNARIKELTSLHSLALAKSNETWELKSKVEIEKATSKSIGRIRTISAATFAFISAGGLIFWIWRKQWERKAQQKDRARIARDLHDHLGAQLTQINLWANISQDTRLSPTELATNLQRISESARSASNNISQLVWVMNPSNDSVEHCIAFLADFAVEFLRPARIEVAFEFQEETPRVSLAMETRNHLLLVVKEILNNVVQHANATTVLMRVSFEPRKLVLSIIDNGTGAPSNRDQNPELRTKESNGGNGLRNLAWRVSEMRGSYSIQASPARGTTVTIEIPLPRAVQ